MEKPPIQKIQPEKKKLHADKLIDATDLEGNKNKLVFEVAERVNEELSKFPEFIGVFPFGSQTKGYNNEESDVDAYVLYEDWTEEMSEKIKTLKEEYGKNGIRVHLMEGCFNNGDVWDIERTIVSPWASILWRQGIGTKIEFWRNEIRGEMKKLSKEAQDRNIRQMVAFFTVHDKKSLPKMKERMALFNEEEWLKKRHDMWERRIKNLVFKNEQ